MDFAHLNENNKKIISIFPGSRLSEINILMPILIQFIQIMNNKYNDFLYIFHATEEHKNIINQYLVKSNLGNFDIISNENIKSNILSKINLCYCKIRNCFIRDL